MRAVLSVLLLAALSSVSAPRGAFAQQASPPTSAQRLASETQSVSQDGKEVVLSMARQGAGGEPVETVSEGSFDVTRRRLTTLTIPR